ncbi:MAG: cupredoxin family copper-binding protein [Gammaproteobacteria bacterium]|nr:cupredoxin family copper-binding protein [Gammaproteobacteria bacterium]MBV9619811.1 cupredoxin family copper-binding protein [Gammaproteobacteria bacterium]
MSAWGGLTAVLAAALLSASPAALPADGGAQVEIKHFMFTPERITIHPGTTLRWVNRDEEPHTIVSMDGIFRSQAVDGGETFTFRFDTPGTYRYVCTVHPQMTGTVVVE